mmetsp:Transcript_15918/g.51853  ORF Transcript_15918/g.51853 Transcript_15918/m.51853 type:complete len:431 (-) Transcript_15918:107-1399(-)
MGAVARVGVPHVEDVLGAPRRQRVVAGPGDAAARVDLEPAPVGRDAPVDVVGHVADLVEGFRAGLRRLVALVDQIPVLLVEERGVLVQHDGRRDVAEPLRHQPRKPRRPHEDGQRALGERLPEGRRAIAQHRRERPDLPRRRGHAVRRQHQRAFKGHGAVVGPVLDEARRHELQRAHVAVELEAAVARHLLRGLEGVGPRVAVAVAERAVVRGAEVGRVQGVLDHRVPAAGEVADAGRDLHLPVAVLARPRVVQLADERRGLEQRLDGGDRPVGKDPDHAVGDLGGERRARRRALVPLPLALRRVRQVRARAGAVVAPAVVGTQQRPVVLDAALAQRAPPVRARVLERAPRPRGLLAADGRAVVPEHEVQAQQLHLVGARRVHAVDDIHGVPVVEPVEGVRCRDRDGLAERLDGRDLLRRFRRCRHALRG